MCRGLSGLRLRLGLDVEARSQMFTPQAIGFVDRPYKDTAAIPKGLGAEHDAEGTLRILPEFELGLTDIEGFSHLMVIWAFRPLPRLRFARHATF
jgi:tRNA (Thr-GGU) A37 N-methylase